MTARLADGGSASAETAVLAGGCFWIMQHLLRNHVGVVSTRVGWIGGQNDNPTEEDNVGHAEAVEVVFDPGQLSYRDLLDFFLKAHRADLGEEVVGSGYRSAIFCTSEAQREIADEVIRTFRTSGHWPGPIATEIGEAGRFWEAEADDQDYFQRATPSGARASAPAHHA